MNQDAGNSLGSLMPDVWQGKIDKLGDCNRHQAVVA